MPCFELQYSSYKLSKILPIGSFSGQKSSIRPPTLSPQYVSPPLESLIDSIKWQSLIFRQ
ncbi:hypothetical protein PanWU01x14_247840 [Parasponia andersonii]|uniref:Uncharacterized protein n=1 Tax=Parasponia andersonii TaxID=3476 RepID=A0A2P5BDS8_PARAD|nr:hypothetical protein PanWU01x14_247840 [Parasponia andersonii]